MTYGDGCYNYVDSFNIKGKEPFTLIAIDSFELSTTGGPFSSYQWYVNGDTIPGANAGKYTVHANGDYQVEVSNEYGCTFLSDVYKVTNWGTSSVTDLLLAKDIRIYPNPVKERIYFESSLNFNILITNIQGQRIVKAVNPKYISLNKFPAGIYILKIMDADGNLIRVEKLVLQ